MSDWRAEFAARGALWRHRPGGPHLIQHLDQRHANGYFDSDAVAADPAFVDRLGREGLAAKFHLDAVDALVAPRSSITAGARLAARWAAGAGLACAAFDLGAGEIDRPIPNDARVLVVTDDVLSGASVRRTIAALGRARVAGVFALVTLAAVSEVDGVPLDSLVRLDFETWPADRCPLCAAGSPARRAPRGRLKEFDRERDF